MEIQSLGQYFSEQAQSVNKEWVPIGTCFDSKNNKNKQKVCVCHIGPCCVQLIGKRPQAPAVVGQQDCAPNRFQGSSESTDSFRAMSEKNEESSKIAYHLRSLAHPNPNMGHILGCVVQIQF